MANKNSGVGRDGRKRAIDKPAATAAIAKKRPARKAATAKPAAAEKLVLRLPHSKVQFYFQPTPARASTRRRPLTSLSSGRFGDGSNHEDVIIAANGIKGPPKRELEPIAIVDHPSLSFAFELAWRLVPRR